MALTDEQKTEQARLIREGSADDCVRFVEEHSPDHMPDADLDLDGFVRRVAGVGKGHDCFALAVAADLGGEQAKPLETRILEEGRGRECAFYATSVHGADFDALQERIIEKGSVEDIDAFVTIAGGHPDADFDRLANARGGREGPVA